MTSHQNSNRLLRLTSVIHSPESAVSYLTDSVPPTPPKNRTTDSPALHLWVRRGQPQTVRAGSKGYAVVKAPDVVIGPDGQHEVWVNGDVRACTCGAAGCAHIEAVERAEKGA